MSAQSSLRSMLEPYLGNRTQTLKVRLNISA